MTFPAEPYWESGSYCLGLGPSDGLQCKSEGLEQMADAAFYFILFFNLLFDFSLSQVKNASGPLESS